MGYVAVFWFLGLMLIIAGECSALANWVMSEMNRANESQHGVERVVSLPQGVVMRCCPGCGYLMDQLLVDMARINFDCFRCDGYKLSEFSPVKLA